MFDWLGDALSAIVQPIIDGVLGGIIEVVFEPFMRMAAWLFVNFILRFAVAIPLWNINKLLILIAIGIAKFTEVLIDYLFVSAFNVLAEDFGLRMLPLVFTIALTLLGMTYVLAAFWMRSTIIVDWKKAFAWLLFAWLFYTFGADFFVQSYILERSLGTVMYEVALDVNIDAENALYPLNELFSGSDVPPTDPEDMFGQGGEAWLKYDVSIDGVDIAMAYFLATPDDLTSSNLIALPQGLDDAFFGGGIFDVSTLFTNDAEEILTDGIAGVLRLFFGLFINVFAILDQVVSLWIAIGLALTFFMLLWVVLLAFFNATEPIAKYLVRSWLDFMLLALFSGIIKAVGLFVLLLAADIPHPIIWIAGGALGLAIGWMANMQAIDGVMQLMKNIQGSVMSAGGAMTGGMSVMPSMGGMGMGGMRGGMGGGGMGGGMGGMASMNPKMMAAQAALGAVGGSAGRSMAGGGGGMGTSPTTGIRSIMSPNYGTKGGMMQHADGGTSPTEGRPKQGAAFGAPAPLNLSPGTKSGGGGASGGMSGGGGASPGLKPTDGKPLPTPPTSNVLTATRQIERENDTSSMSPADQAAAVARRRAGNQRGASPNAGKVVGPTPPPKPPTKPNS